MMKAFVFFLTLISFHIQSHEIDLSFYESSIYSQNGEDGILQILFELIPPDNKFCIEFGAYDGVTGSNTYLLRSKGWDCLLLDRQFSIPKFNLYQEFITAENITSLFDKYRVPHDLGLLSIDIDYNDFYIWKSLDEKYQPAVVLIEYNATHLPFEDKVVLYQPYFAGDGTNYFGASILALYNLGVSKGYSLVYADMNGVNLFFVRNDLIEKHQIPFKGLNEVEKLYQTPKYGKGPNGGHREDLKHRKYKTSTEIMSSL